MLRSQLSGRARHGMGSLSPRRWASAPRGRADEISAGGRLAQHGVPADRLVLQPQLGCGAAIPQGPEWPLYPLAAVAAAGLLALGPPPIGPGQPQLWRARGQGQRHVQQAAHFRHGQFSQEGFRPPAVRDGLATDRGGMVHLTS